MSRGKRQFDEEGFDEYALWDDRIRGDGRARLEDMPPSNQDYGVGPGYLGRARQSPRSPSIGGDDEIRPSRRRAASPDDSDRGGERRGFRKVGDAYDPDDAPVVSEAQVKRALHSSIVYRDWMYYGSVRVDPDATSNGNFAFLRQQRVVDSDSGHVVLNNLQLRGCLYVTAETVEPLPEAIFVEVVVVYDRFRSQLSGSLWNSILPVSSFSWSDCFDRSGTTFADHPTVDGLDTRVFNFTNPELSSRLRIMFRKMYKLDCRKLNQTFFSLSGTGLNVDPVLNYNYSLEGQFYSGNGGSILPNIPSGSTCCLVDEFVNLCSLPARYKSGPDLATAVDTEGGVSVGIRCSHPTLPGVNYVLNTRLNVSVDPSTMPVFY